MLDRVFNRLTDYPEGFTPHPKLAKQFEGRQQLFEENGEIDWAAGEALAIGSLLLDGRSVRLAGEDSRRGTFSQRHASLVDYETGEQWIPLDTLTDEDTKFWCTTRCSVSMQRSGTNMGTHRQTRRHS